MKTQEEFAALENVSRETFELFLRWKTLLERWNKRINLVAPSSLHLFWSRHAYDSWQLTRYLPSGGTSILDLGSGAGFPGLALAIYLKSQDEKGHVTLVESAGKKANFLKTVIRELGLPAEVWPGRAEDMPTQTLSQPYDFITARAFAPLERLLTYAHPFYGPATTGLFLKGQKLQQELTKAQKTWKFTHQIHPSLSDPTGYVLRIEDLQY